MRDSAGRAHVVIVTARAISQAVALASAAAVLHAIAAGRDALPLLPTAVVLSGATLVLFSVLRERGTVRQSGGLVAVVIAAAVAWGLALAARSPDVLAVLTRVTGFAILGEAYLWRVLGVARGLQRWHEVRSDALAALGAVVVADIVPGPIDRGALPALALAVAFAGAVALSLARASEELSLSAGQVRGRPAPEAATGTAFALGLLALAVGIGLPALQSVLLGAAARVGPLLGEAIFWILLPLGYVAAYLVYVAQWLREIIRPTGFAIPIPQAPFDPDADARRIRDLEQARPYIFGAVEAIVALVALGFALALVARLMQERRALLPEGGSVDRSPVEGIGLGAMVRALFPPRRARPRPPADDGTPATALRRVYWALLDLAEREGPGRRAPAETPAEHERRLLGSGERWRDVSGIVRAFEQWRYGDADPDDATVERARGALRRAAAAPRGAGLAAAEKSEAGR